MGFADTFIFPISRIMRSLKNFLRTQNVSGNFVTKSHHYLQVWSVIWSKIILSGCYFLAPLTSSLLSNGLGYSRLSDTKQITHKIGDIAQLHKAYIQIKSRYKT